MLKSKELRFDPYIGRGITKEDYIETSLGGLPNVSMLGEEWEKLPLITDYDSRNDTLLHIKRVNELLMMASSELLKRAAVHDNSKLQDPEKTYFDVYTPGLKHCEYGSDEYKSFLKGLKVALDHHYENNSHHPEHYKDGISGFDLFDLIEMFFDWKAASERHETGDIVKSIKHNKGRFSLSDQIESIFLNTADRLGYVKK